MWGYIARRVLATVPVVAIVALVVFSILHVAPGDPAALIAGDQATPEQIAAIRAKLHLDLPIYQQFALWLGNAVAGDLGTSIFSNRPVATLFLQRLEPTVALAVTTTIVAVVLAVPAGVLAAWRAGSLVDRAVMGTAVLGFAFPVFVVGYILIYLFAMKLRLLPIQGYRPIGEGFWPCLQHLVLPSLALGLSFMALIARITRASVLEVLGQDHIRTARAKGLNERTVLLRHALRSALNAPLTMGGLQVGLLLAGVVVIESVFAWPGVGLYTVQSIASTDFPAVAGVTLVLGALYVVINALVDLAQVIADPRLRAA
jgi:peptide/nickel transport system permease protein